MHSAHASKINCKTKHVIEAFGNYISTEFLKIGPSSPDMLGGEVSKKVKLESPSVLIKVRKQRFIGPFAILYYLL